MTTKRTLLARLDMNGVTPTTADLADLKELRDALRSLDGVSTRTGVDLSRVRPGQVYNSTDISQMIVTISGAGVSSGALTAVFVQWMKGRTSRGVRLRLGENEIELTGPIDDETRGLLFDLFEASVRDVTHTDNDRQDGVS